MSEMETFSKYVSCCAVVALGFFWGGGNPPFRIKIGGFSKNEGESYNGKFYFINL